MKLFFKYSVVLPKYLFFLFLSLVVISCVNKDQQNDSETQFNELERIKTSGILRVAVDYNSTDYFVYRGKIMGFKYELLQELAKDLGVELEIVVSKNLQQTINGLINAQVDLIAKNITVTRRLRNQIEFTTPIRQTTQVLIQQQKLLEGDDSIFVHSTLDLAGKKVVVQKESPYYRRLINLSREIGYPIEVVEDKIYGVEKLIAQVANGEIDYTVCDENVAKLNNTYFSNIDVSLKVSFPQDVAWAVRKKSDEWKIYLDEWITNFKSTGKYKYIYHKYFLSDWSVYRMESGFHSINGGKISVYDTIVKRLSLEYNWDWRLISSIIYQESRFNPNADSWAGAYGLMQIMPATAERMGVKNYKDPAQNIEGGILMLNWLNKRFIESIPDSAQRIRFVLASYNIGLGHVLDAQRLAEKYGKDRNIWDDNVDYYLLNKSMKKYYKDSVVHYGYCRGEHAYNYVNRVVTNYNHYLNVIPGL